MKKLNRFMLLTLVLVFLLPDTTAYAVTVPAEFRIGLEYKYKNAESIPIGNKVLDAGYEGGNGFYPAARLYSASGFTAAPAKLYYATTGQSFSTYEQAKAARDSYAASGKNGMAVCLGANRWSVYLGGYGTAQEARNAGTAVSPARKVVLSFGQNEAILFDNQDSFVQIADAEDGVILLGERKYRGRIEFSRYAEGNGSSITPVNVTTIDQYLFSVVPSEMFSSWHSEALKAQAVACRNYAITRSGVHQTQGYDLCDISHCQNYIGAGNESPSGTQAVQATTGLLIYYQNQPINAVYFSSSGGVTADSGDVWSNRVAYLLPVAEINEPDAKVWSRGFTLSEITGLLSANNVNIGQAVNVSIEGFSSGGRVNQLVITGTNGSKTLEKEEIRTFFRFSAGGSLESRNFTISNNSQQGVGEPRVAISNGQESISTGIKGLAVLSSTQQIMLDSGTVYTQSGNTSQRYDAAATAVTSVGDSVVFSGRGWGHGVGMSQYGAKGMAERGYSFMEILEHYYTGVTIARY